MVYRRQRSDTNRVSGSILIEPQREREGEGSVLDEIFQFIGSKPEEAVSVAKIHVHTCTCSCTCIWLLVDRHVHL